MADHVDENAATPENKNLDQSAVDEALASMPVDDSDEAAAKIESAAHPNGGETFAPSQSDGHEDLDAAIAALQADEPGDEAVAMAEPSASGEASQEELDAALAAMQADATNEAEAADVGVSESGDATQEEIDAAIAAMQADTGAAEVGDVEAPDQFNDQDAAEGQVRETGQEDVEAENAEMRDKGSEDNEVDALVENETGDDGEKDVDATIAAIQDDRDESSEETPPHSDMESSASEPETEPAMPEIGPEAASSVANTFSGLDEGDLGAHPSPQETPGAKESTQSDTTAGGLDDFSTLADEQSEPAVAFASPGRGAPGPISAGSADSPVEEAVERPSEVPKPESAAEIPTAGRKMQRSGRKRLGIVLLCLIVVAGSVVYFGRDFYWAYRAGTQEPKTEPRSTEAAAVAPSPPPSPALAAETPYDEKLQEVARLRAELLSKRDEIGRLRQFYRDGISELEEEIQQEAVKHNVQKFSQAVAHPKIELDLESIRRRWAYIDELAKPLHWLQEGSEELLFLSRRTEIDLQMSEIAAGIELTKHMRRLNASLQKYRLSPERLAIDVGSSGLRPLEEIWESVGMQNKGIAQKAVANGDPAIIDDICSGNTGRIAELTFLTIKASKCLSQLDTSELFLNRLTFLSPVAAKYLSSWKGQWLCLNGFQDMTPEVARYLFQWEGKWISLNGLSDFSPRIGELLLSWEGDQLELMGLVFNADQPEKIGLRQLADWEKSGGRLFLPEPVRAEMEKLE